MSGRKECANLAIGLIKFWTATNKTTHIFSLTSSYCLVSYWGRSLMRFAPFQNIPGIMCNDGYASRASGGWGGLGLGCATNTQAASPRATWQIQSAGFCPQHAA